MGRPLQTASQVFLLRLYGWEVSGATSAAGGLRISSPAWVEQGNPPRLKQRFVCGLSQDNLLPKFLAEDATGFILWLISSARSRCTLCFSIASLSSFQMFWPAFFVTWSQGLHSSVSWAMTQFSCLGGGRLGFRVRKVLWTLESDRPIPHQVTWSECTAILAL